MALENLIQMRILITPPLSPLSFFGPARAHFAHERIRHHLPLKQMHFIAHGATYFFSGFMQLSLSSVLTLAPAWIPPHNRSRAHRASQLRSRRIARQHRLMQAAQVA